MADRGTIPSSLTTSSSLVGTTPRSLLPTPCYACIYHPPGAERPAAPSGTLTAVAEQFSPRYERHDDDLVSIDVSGLERLLGPPRAIGEELRREAAARGFRAHVAVARTRMAALVAALARPGLTVVPHGGEAAALAPLPVALFTHLVDDDRTQSSQRTQRNLDHKNSAVSAFERWGLKTLGEVAALPAADLVSRLGRRALEWQAIARGDDIRPLVPTLAEERFESSIDLDWPIEELEPLSFVLTRLLEPLSIRLERRDRGAAVLHVLLQLVTRDTASRHNAAAPAGWERVVYARRLELPSPMRDVRTLRTLALLDLESHPPDVAIDRVTIVIDPTPGRVLQHTLFTRAHPTPEQISTLLARLGAVMGQDRVGAPAEVDSYRPGAFVMTAFSTDHPAIDERRARRARKDISRTERFAGSAGFAFHGEPPDPGLRSQVATATFSEDSAGSAAAALTVVSALRRCRQPVPARVAVADGRPVRVTTDRRGFAGGAVVRAAGPWRTSGEWWATDVTSRKAQVESRPSTAEARLSTADVRLSTCAAAWSRDEWDVSLSDGAMYRIFQDRQTEGWFIDAIVD